MPLPVSSWTLISQSLQKAKEAVIVHILRSVFANRVSEQGDHPISRIADSFPIVFANIATNIRWCILLRDVILDESVDSKLELCERRFVVGLMVSDDGFLSEKYSETNS
jgi:hypothetical protein